MENGERLGVHSCICLVDSQMVIVVLLVWEMGWYLKSWLGVSPSISISGLHADCEADLQLASLSVESFCWIETHVLLLLEKAEI